MTNEGLKALCNQARERLVIDNNLEDLFTIEWALEMRAERDALRAEVEELRDELNECLRLMVCHWGAKSPACERLAALLAKRPGE